MYSSIDKSKFEDATSFTIRRSYNSVNKDDKEAAQLLKKAVEIREHYLTFSNKEEVYPQHFQLKNQATTGDANRALKMNKGVFEITEQTEATVQCEPWLLLYVHQKGGAFAPP